MNFQQLTNLNKHCFTVAEAVAFSGIGRTKFYELIKRGEIVPRKCGKRTLILREELIVYLENLPTGDRSPEKNEIEIGR